MFLCITVSPRYLQNLVRFCWVKVPLRQRDQKGQGTKAGIQSSAPEAKFLKHSSEVPHSHCLLEPRLGIPRVNHWNFPCEFFASDWQTQVPTASHSSHLMPTSRYILMIESALPLTSSGRKCAYVFPDTLAPKEIVHQSFHIIQVQYEKQIKKSFQPPSFPPCLLRMIIIPHLVTFKSDLELSLKGDISFGNLQSCWGFHESNCAFCINRMAERIFPMCLWAYFLSQQSKQSSKDILLEIN